MATVKRSQSERLYSRRNYDTPITNVNDRIEEWRGHSVKHAWPKEKTENGGVTEQQRTERRNLIRRLVSYILKKMGRRRKRNRRSPDLKDEENVEEVPGHEMSEQFIEAVVEHAMSEGSDSLTFRSACSDINNEEISDLKNKLKQKEKEIEKLQQRIKDLEAEKGAQCTENKGTIVLHVQKAKKINLGRETTQVF